MHPELGRLARALECLVFHQRHGSPRLGLGRLVHPIHETFLQGPEPVYDRDVPRPHHATDCALFRIRSELCRDLSPSVGCFFRFSTIDLGGGMSEHPHGVWLFGLLKTEALDLA